MVPKEFLHRLLRRPTQIVQLHGDRPRYKQGAGRAVGPAAGVVNRELVVYDKNEWIKRYVDPGVVVTCTMSGSQKAAFAYEGSVLIDDRKKNIDAWESAGGIGILHTSAKETIETLKELRNND